MYIKCWNFILAVLLPAELRHVLKQTYDKILSNECFWSVECERLCHAFGKTHMNVRRELFIWDIYIHIYTILCLYITDGMSQLIPLEWRHNRHDSVSNHQPHDCLLNRLFRRRSKKTSKLRVTGLCAGKSTGTGEFPAQMASNAENVSIWWRHHVNAKIWYWSHELLIIQMSRQSHHLEIMCVK